MLRPLKKCQKSSDQLPLHAQQRPQPALSENFIRSENRWKLAKLLQCQDAIYVCMYVCMHVCMYVYMHACMHVCMYVCVCVYICKYVRMYVCMYVCMYVFMYVRMYVCVYVSYIMHTRTHTHTHTHHFRVHYSPRGCSAEAWWSQVWSDLIEVREMEIEREMRRWRRIFLQSTNDWGGQSWSDLNKVRERWRDSERGERRERERERERNFIRKQWVHGGGQERG